MIASRLRGLFGPVVTNFDERGELARAPFERNIALLLEEGLAGIVVAGSTGEAALLEEKERSLVIEWARGVVRRDRVLLAGVGAESTRLTIARGRAASAAGADALLVVAPHYYGAAMTPAALERHFRAVADASAVPVVLYNIPKYMHFRLEPSLVARLAEHPNIAGIKDSSGDAALIGGYLESRSDGFAVLTGSGSGLAAALEAGASGGILAVALFAARLSLSVWDCHVGGDPAAARDAQDRLAPLATEVVGRLGVAGVKAALDLAGDGLAGGPVRPPLLDLPQSSHDEVAALLDRALSAERR